MTVRRTYEVLLFDIGGVFVEGSGIGALDRWFGGAVPSAEIWRRWLASPAVRAFETGLLDGERFATEIVAEMGLPVTAEEFLEDFDTWTIGVYPHAVGVIERIPRTYHRSVLSNSNDRHWPHVLRMLSVETSFDSHFVSHLIGRIKPDAEAFEHVIEALGCRPDAIVFFDDNVINVEAARAVGIDAHVTGPDELERTLTGLGLIPE